MRRRGTRHSHKLNETRARPSGGQSAKNRRRHLFSVGAVTTHHLSLLKALFASPVNITMPVPLAQMSICPTHAVTMESTSIIHRIDTREPRRLPV